MSPLATLASAPLLARGLGPVGRGEYGVATSVGTLALSLGAWGQAELFLARAREGNADYSAHSRIAWLTSCASAAICFVALLALGVPLMVSALAAVAVPLLSQSNLWRSSSIAERRLRPLALSAALVNVLRVGTLVALTASALLSAETAVATYQFGAGLGAVLTVGISHYRGDRRNSGERLRPSALLTAGATVTAFNVLNAIATRADLVVLQLVSSAPQVGIYAAPASLPTAALALSAAIKPRLQAEALGAKPRSGIIREALYVVILGGVGAGATWLSAPLLVKVFFGPGFAPAVGLLQILSLAIVPLLLVDLAYGALIVFGRRRQMIVVAAISGGVNVAALFLLCPEFGAVGAAVASVIGYSVAATCSWFTVLRAATRVSK